MTETPITDPTVADLRRELDKAREVLLACNLHLSRHAEANAALHCADRVMYSPLHAKTEAAITGISGALARHPAPTPGTLATTSKDCNWAALMADLDRCEHGRHEGDACGFHPAGVSDGNPHMRPGSVIGYSLRAEPITMPHRDDKHDPAAWRRKPEAAEGAGGSAGVAR